MDSRGIGTRSRNEPKGAGNAEPDPPSAEALLLRNGHDDLRLGGGLQKVLVTHHRGDDGRLVRIVRLESSQRRDAVTVEIDGQRRRLDLVEGGPHHPVADLTSLLLDGNSAPTHRRPGTPKVL